MQVEKYTKNWENQFQPVNIIVNRKLKILIKFALRNFNKKKTQKRFHFHKTNFT